MGPVAYLTIITVALECTNTHLGIHGDSTSTEDFWKPLTVAISFPRVLYFTHLELWEKLCCDIAVKSSSTGNYFHSANI